MSLSDSSSSDSCLVSSAAASAAPPAAAPAEPLETGAADNLLKPSAITSSMSLPLRAATTALTFSSSTSAPMVLMIFLTSLADGEEFPPRVARR